MKKMLVLILTLFLTLPLILAGCGDSNDYIPITEIVWEYDEIELMPGELFDLNFKVYPNNATEAKPALIVNTERGYVTSALSIDKANVISYGIIDENTIQIIDFKSQDELKLSISYKAGNEDKVAVCKIKKREMPTSINFENDVYNLSTGQTKKLVVNDNYGKEIDLKKYKVEFSVPELYKDNIIITDSSKGIVEAKKEGTFTLGLKISFVKMQDSEGNIVYKDLETSCQIKISDSYTKVQMYGIDGLTLTQVGDLKVASGVGEIRLQFANNSFVVGLTNCEFKITAVEDQGDTSVSTYIKNNIVGSIDESTDEYVIKIKSLPFRSVFFVVSSSITNSDGVAYSELINIKI